MALSLDRPKQLANKIFSIKRKSS